jgi:hypothetical protein
MVFGFVGEKKVGNYFSCICGIRLPLSCSSNNGICRGVLYVNFVFISISSPFKFRNSQCFIKPILGFLWRIKKEDSKMGYAIIFKLRYI